MSNIDEQDLERLAGIFKALSNPSRLRIFLRLRDCCGPGRILLPGEEDNCCVGDVSQDLTLSPSTVSHHLKELRQAGLISVRRRGQKTQCRLNQEALAQVARFLRG